VTPRLARAGGERGAALVLTLVVIALVAGLGGSLLLVVSTETAVQTHHQQGLAARQAAESGLACAVGDLRRAADWTAVLSGAASPSGACLAPVTQVPHGLDLDVPAFTAALQAATDARYGGAADTPRWMSWMVGLAPTGAGAVSPIAVTVWVAYKVDDGDDDAQADANGVVWVRAEAWGSAGARAAIEAVVRRGPDAVPPAAVVAWRVVR
jgi:hypothetical protein